MSIYSDIFTTPKNRLFFSTIIVALMDLVYLRLSFVGEVKAVLFVCRQPGIGFMLYVGPQSV